MFKTKALLLSIFILLLASSVSSQFLSQGVLRKTADCLVYDALPGNGPGYGSLALVSHPVDSFLGYFPGDTVFIYGNLLIHVVAPCPGDASYSLDVMFIGAPNANISVEGILTWGVEAGCILVQTSEGYGFLLDNIGNCQIGDTVQVSGNYDPYCVTICMQGIGCINNAIVTKPSGDGDLTGSLVQGTGCIYFESSLGQKYAVLDADGNLITDFGPYQPGDAAHIVGEVIYDPSICSSTNYAITAEAISQEGCLCVGIRGNANGDINGNVDVSDLTFMVDFLFRGGPPPMVFDEANFDGSSGENLVDISDVVAFVDYLFRLGSPPEPCQ